MPLTIQDHAGRSIDLPATPQRVYPTGNPACAAVWCVAPDRLIGWHAPNSINPADTLLPEMVAALPRVPRLSGPDINLAIAADAVRAHKADLIVDFGIPSGHFADHADRLQAATGVPVLMVDGRLAHTGKALDLLGRIFDVRARTTLLTAWADDMIARTVDAIPRSQGPRVHYAIGERGEKTVYRASIHSEAMELLGAILSPEIPSGEAGRVTVPFDVIRNWDPEVILTIEPGLGGPTGILGPDWQALNAVRNGRLHLAPRLFLSWLDHPPSFNRIIGLPWLASVLYPGLFAEDLADLACAFYTLFYGIELEPAQAARAIRTAD